MPFYGVFPGIVRGQGQGKIPVETIEQLPQVLRPTPDIFIRIVGVPHLQAHGRLGHELHQPDRSGT